MSFVLYCTYSKLELTDIVKNDIQINVIKLLPTLLLDININLNILRTATCF